MELAIEDDKLVPHQHFPAAHPLRKPTDTHPIMPTTEEPDRSSKPPQEADDQPPPSNDAPAPSASIDMHFDLACDIITSNELDTLKQLTQRVLALIPNAGSVRVRIVNDADMIDAHMRYCDLDTTTDVLTFDLAYDDEGFDAKVLDTDLIICADEARRQANQRNHSITHELLLYITHGILHCLGYDDHSDEEYARMHAREDQLLTAAGVGAIFNTDTPSDTHEESQS